MKLNPFAKKILFFIFAILTISVNFVLINKVEKRQNYEKSASPETLFLVTRVIDGDTVELENGDKVRYLAIDAPELGDQNQCYSKEAKISNESLVLGKKVRLEYGKERLDKYKRVLAYVWSDGFLVNLELVRNGSARADTYPSQGMYDDQIVEAETQAKKNLTGLWGSCF
jgi:micrococcal nuclease